MKRKGGAGLNNLAPPEPASNRRGKAMKAIRHTAYKVKRHFLTIAAVAVVALVISAIPALASVISAPTTVATIATGMTAAGSTYGTSPEPYTNTFYAEGKHWIFYLDSVSSFRYASLEPGETWEHHTIEFGTGLYSVEFSVWYDKSTNTIHYCRHDIDEPTHHVVYRMGTPNADGTITWAAAEQLVSDTPADLVTWRTTIAVDEDGNPWVAWIDTNGVDAYGIVYIEASSTHDGTWTQVVAVSDEIDTADYHAWFLQLCPVGATPGNLMELIWSMECQDGGAHDGEVALEARRYSTETGWTGTEEIADYGVMAAVLPELFDSYDIGLDVWVVYTQAATGDLYCRVRTAAQTWVTANAADMILDEALVGYSPVLSGYQANGVGEDLICIYVQDTSAIGYMMHTYGDDVDEWSATDHIWTVPVPVEYYITRHTASYTYGSPVTFAWQVTHLDDVPEPEYDTIYYWWLDNSTGGLGYYPTPPIPASAMGSHFLQIIMPIVLAVGIVISVLGAKQGDHRMLLIGVVTGLTGFVMIQAILGTL